jgi:hypothetical protein
MLDGRFDFKGKNRADLFFWNRLIESGDNRDKKSLINTIRRNYDKRQKPTRGKTSGWVRGDESLAKMASFNCGKKWPTIMSFWTAKKVTML